MERELKERKSVIERETEKYRENEGEVEMEREKGRERWRVK